MVVPARSPLADGVVREHGKIFLEKNRRRPMVVKGRARVKSDMADECDINKIVAKMLATGDKSALKLDQSWQAQDFTSLPQNYADAVMLVRETSMHFDALPSGERQKYDNDPQKWALALKAAQEAAVKAAGEARLARQADEAEEKAYREKRRKAVLLEDKKV